MVPVVAGALRHRLSVPRRRRGQCRHRGYGNSARRHPLDRERDGAEAAAQPQAGVRRAMKRATLPAGSAGGRSRRAAAQSYPDRNVRLVVPFTAGGAPDVVGRVFAQALTEQTGRSFVVENRPGADGVLGAQVVAEAPPDGATLLVTSSSFAINPSFHKKLPFDVDPRLRAGQQSRLDRGLHPRRQPGAAGHIGARSWSRSRRSPTRTCRSPRPASAIRCTSPPSCSSR